MLSNFATRRDNVPAETEEALSFHGVCHYIGRLSKAAKAGMKAALADTPKCHFAWLEALLHAIRSRGLRQLEADGLIAREPAPEDRRKTLVRITSKGYEACRQCEDALSDYFTCVMARLEPEQAAQLNALRGALMDAIVAENAARIKPKGEPNHDENL